MIGKSSAIVATLLVSGAAWGQPTGALSFEVASVKAVPPQERRDWQPPRVGADRIEFHNATLWYCVSYAYRMKSYQMSGPDWLREARV